MRYVLTPGSLSDSASTGQRTRRNAMRAALTTPSATEEERRIAQAHLEDAERQLRRLAALTRLWRRERPRRALASVALDSAYRKRERAEAAVAALLPALARRRMDGDPDAALRH